MESASSNIAKKFRLLFVLPRSTSVVVFVYLVSSFILGLLYEYSIGTLMPTSPFLIIVVLLLQISVLKTIQLSASRISPFASLRRIAASLTVVNTVWFILTISIFSIEGINQTIGVLTLTFTAAVSVAFTLFILWPVFVNSFIKSFLLSALVPIPMMIRYYPFLFSDKSSHLFAPSILGTTFVVTMIIVLYTINSSTKRTLRIGSFDLLKGFLDAWINFNPTRLERLLEDHSKESSATTHFIDFSTAESKVALVVPEVHPGPFAPIGSYDLPGRLSWLLKSQGYKDCFVLHGAVDHSLNLLSAREVESYLSQLAAQSKESLFSNKISTPLSKESGKSVVTGIKIGDSLCLLVSIPTGSEDYPASFRESVKNLCAKIGYRKTILIDAHNAIGEDPSPELQEEVLRGVKTVASELFTAQQFTFSLNHSSKSYVFKSNDEADVGAAGLGCLILSIDDKRYALVYADSNNSALGLRDEIKKTLNDKGIFLLEFCTSDSHFNAARIRNKRGYLVLGESTPPQKIVDDVASMVDEATSLLHEASANVCQTVSRIRLAEDNLLESFEKAITESVHLTLWGLAIILSSLIIESVLLMTVT